MHDHKIEYRKNLYEAINTLNSVKFKINKALLNFLENDETGIFLFNSYMEDLKSKGEKYQTDLTIKIAKAYSTLNVPIYLTTHAD